MVDQSLVSKKIENLFENTLAYFGLLQVVKKNVLISYQQYSSLFVTFVS
jgi:hypothetical protein